MALLNVLLPVLTALKRVTGRNNLFFQLAASGLLQRFPKKRRQKP
jgi:hypothetical protein